MLIKPKKIRLLTLTLIILFIQTALYAEDITFQPPPSPGQAPGTSIEPAISPSDITNRANQLSKQNQNQLQNKLTAEAAKTPPGPAVNPLPIATESKPLQQPSLTPPQNPSSSAPESNMAPPPTAAFPAESASAATPVPAPVPAQQNNNNNTYTGFQGKSSGSSIAPSGGSTTTKGSGWDIKY